jgi:hypothetical protein
LRRPRQRHALPDEALPKNSRDAASVMLAGMTVFHAALRAEAVGYPAWPVPALPVSDQSRPTIAGGIARFVGLVWLLAAEGARR